MSRKDKKNRSDMMRALGMLSQIGLSIVVCVGLGVFLGRFLDGFFNTSPWLLLVFTLLGAAAAVKSMYDMANRV